MRRERFVGSTLPRIIGLERDRNKFSKRLKCFAEDNQRRFSFPLAAARPGAAFREIGLRAHHPSFHEEDHFFELGPIFNKGVYPPFVFLRTFTFGLD